MAVSLAGLIAGTVRAEGQQLQDLALTSELDGHTYCGDLPTISVPWVDPAECASTIGGSFSAQIKALIGRLEIDFDAGHRQFGTRGLKRRNYAPREAVANIRADYSRRGFTVSANGKFRHITDGPAIPIYRQPSYGSGGLFLMHHLQVGDNLVTDYAVRGEYVAYDAPKVRPDIDLLDRTSFGVEAGTTWQREGNTWNNWIRGAATYQNHRFPKQKSGVVGDPFRRDQTVSLGFAWRVNDVAYEHGSAEIRLEGTANRSNSRRPEYNAVRASLAMEKFLGDWGQARMNLAFAKKAYTTEGQGPALIPGEESDNKSSLSLGLTRYLRNNLDGAVDVEWARAETNVTGWYVRSFGASFTLTYRPFAN